MKKKTIKTDKYSNNRNSSERYLVTYADLLTLLFALFIILYSISKPDAEKMQAVLLAMNNVFSPNQIIEGNNLSPNMSSQKKPPVVVFPTQPLNIPKTQEQIKAQLNYLVENKTILLENMPDGVKISIPNKFLFQSASATLVDNSLEILDTIASSIASLDMQIQIDGHTDSVPIKSFTYASNWELSAARAVNMLQALASRGVPAYNLVARACGEQRPVADNATETGREKNRRVEIMITAKDADAATTTASVADISQN